MADMCEYFDLKSIPTKLFAHLDDNNRMCKQYGLQKREIGVET